MTAHDLFRAGRLKEAIQALVAEVREHPADYRRRTFLFELLCFAGELDRAQKQLDVLAQESRNAELGALLYQAALAAEKSRQELFAGRNYPPAPPAAPSGVLNGKPFQEFTDADPRIGQRLEIFAGGQYLWIPFAHIASIEMQPPRWLRDLLWASALVRPGPSLKNQELGEVLLPVLSPFSWQHSEDNVKLGRATDWVQTAEGVVPVGQKLFLADGEEIPLLEIRHLEFARAEAASS